MRTSHSLSIWSVGLLWCSGLSQLCYQDNHEVDIYPFDFAFFFWQLYVDIWISSCLLTMWHSRDKKCWSCGSEALSKGSLFISTVNSRHILLTPKLNRPAKWRGSAAGCWKVPERGVEGGRRREPSARRKPYGREAQDGWTARVATYQGFFFLLETTS